ncbi:hypothetical protein PMAYCL1PPCAC_12323, partial [Pristionchus mayeri]
EPERAVGGQEGDTVIEVTTVFEPLLYETPKRAPGEEKENEAEEEKTEVETARKSEEKGTSPIFYNDNL